MDLPFIPAMHTPSIKSCQTGEGSSFMLQTHADTHTHTHTHMHAHTGGMLIYAAVYYHYHMTRGSEQEPSCISPLEAHHHHLSLRCLSSRHFTGGPAGVPTLFASSSPPSHSLSVALLCCFNHFLDLFLIYDFSFPL